MLGHSSEIEGGDSDESTSSRLSKVESLKKQGLISDEEYLSQRERILSEI